MPRANEARHGEGDTPAIRCYRVQEGGWLPLVPPVPPPPLPSLRKSEWPWSRQGLYLPSPTFMTCISRLPFPCPLALGT